VPALLNTRLRPGHAARDSTSRRGWRHNTPLARRSVAAQQQVPLHSKKPLTKTGADSVLTFSFHPLKHLPPNSRPSRQQRAVFYRNLFQHRANYAILRLVLPNFRLHCGLERIMKKISIMAAVAALTVATAAPVLADTKTQNDPFVSTQGSALGADGTTLAIIGGVLVVVAIAAADGT
jgi:hypothetical protein